MVDGTDRRQPVYHRVSTVKGLSVVHPIEGEDTVGCRVSPSSHVQHPADRQEPCRSHHDEQWYVVRGISYMEPMGPLSFPKFYNFYDRVLAVIVLVCLPLCILTFLTVRLIKAMKARRRMQSEMQSQHSQPDNSMTFALVIVVIVFIVCRAPLLIWKVMKLLEWLSRVGWCYVDIIYYTLLASNSAVNVIIYIIINRRFRNVLFTNVCRRRSAIPVVTSCETVDTRL